VAAEFDLDEIWEYIAADKIDAADHWIDILFSAFESLGARRKWGTHETTSRLTPCCSGPWAPTS
jgi:plasmid stabilization system protein ParE